MRRTIHLVILLSTILLSAAWGRVAQQDACPPAGPGPGGYKGSCPTHSNQPNCHPLELFEISRQGSVSRIISRADYVYRAPDGSLTKPQNCADLTTSYYRQNPAGGNWFWEYDSKTHTGSGYATMHDQFSPDIVQLYGDRLASLPQNFENNRADPEMDWSIRTRYSPIPALYDRYTDERPCFVRVTYEGSSRDFRVAENGPALWTGKVLDLSPAALTDLGIYSGGPHFVTFEILQEGCPAIERRPDYTPENTRAELLVEDEPGPLVLQGDRDDSRRVKFRNLGDVTWFREDGIIHLADREGMPSLVYCDEWRSVSEPGTFVEQQVLPGEVATFPIPVCRHSMTPDEYGETFALKAMTGVPFWVTGDGRQDSPAVDAGTVTLRVVSATDE
jgi:hypothetical protein